MLDLFGTSVIRLGRNLVDFHFKSSVVDFGFWNPNKQANKYQTQ